MLRWLVNLSLSLRYIIIALAGVLILFSVVQLRTTPIDVYPEFNPPFIEVQTEALGLAANEVESLITTPLEADLLNGVAWLDRIYSQSVAGLSSIIMVFEPGTDPLLARQAVQERLTQTFALPNVSKPPTMLQPLSTSSRVMIVGLSSADLSLIDMSVLAHWNIRPRLTGVPGVANVAIWGERDSQLQVLVDPQKLHDAEVTLQKVIETTGEALWVSPLSYLESSSPGTTGWIDTPNQRLGIRHNLPISTPNDLAQVVVDDTEGKLRLGDVATIVEDHQPLIGDASGNKGASLLLVVEKFAGANTLDVTRGVEEALEALRPGLVGMNVDTTVFRSANYIERALSNLSSWLVSGAVLLTIVVTLFFLGWRTALICLIAILVSLFAAVFVLASRGATFNVMVLAGLAIALGIVIDDAVISVENIARRLSEPQSDDAKSTASIILEAALEMRGPAFFATLIVLLAVMPLFFLEGLANAFFQPLAVSYVIAVLVSILVALLVTPALCFVLWGSVPKAGNQPPLIRALQSVYNGILARSIRLPNMALIIAGVITVIGIVALLPLRPSLMPEFKHTDLRIQWEGAPSTSRQEMNRITAQVTTELSAIPGVRNVGSHIGRAITGDQVVGINSGELWINLDPAANYDTTVSTIRDVISGYPGLLREVETYQPDRIDQVLIPTTDDVVVRIYGDDMTLLDSKAKELSQKLSGINGLADVRPISLVNEPQVEIEVKLSEAQRFGLKPGDVRRTAATLLSGLRVGSLYEEQKVFDVVVWGVPEIRTNLDDVRNLMIDAPNDTQVRLGDVADIRIVPTPISIKRDAVSRYIDVVGNINGRNASAVVSDIQNSLSTMEFPLEFHAEIFNQAGARQANLQRMLVFVAVAVIGIFLVLQAAFDSWHLSILAILTLPMAAAGGAVAILLTGGVLSLGSLFGFLAVLGIVMRNGIVMFQHFQYLTRQKDATFGPELILRGAQERVGPIVMSALAIGISLLPVLFAGDVSGNEIVRPMSIVILGGLITTVILDLFVLPALYLRFAPTMKSVDWDMLPFEQPQLRATGD